MCGTGRPEGCDASHVACLNRLVVQWRVSGDVERFVPWFDPRGAGTEARVLLLLESPGPRTIAAGELGVSSLSNDAPTSRRLRSALSAAELDPGLCLRWNVVPWPSYDERGRRRPPRVEDLEEARPHLAALVDELPHLRVVVTFGAAALDGWMRHLTLTADPRPLPTLAVPHPSPTNGHRRKEAFARTVSALATAARLARDP